MGKINANETIDEEWFEQIASGDDNAFTMLYYASYKEIFGFLFTLTRNKEDAEDLLQNTYINIRNGAHLYRKQGTPMTWMCTIAKNQYLNLVRKRANRKTVDFLDNVDYISEGVESSKDDTKRVEDTIVLKTALEKLDEQERVIVVLHMVNGLKHREIADTIGIPLSTVLSKYNRSLKKLRNYLEG